MVKAAVIPAPGHRVEVRSFAEPVLEPGAVLLRTVMSEVCGTDVHLRHGRLAGVPYPLIPGHVSVGTVEQVNGTVQDVQGIPIITGAVVTFLDVFGTCNNCWYCLVAKQTTRCSSRKVYGITMGAEDGLHGGWSEKILLKPGTKILPLPASLSPDKWMAAGCGLPTALHAVDRGGIKIGDHVVVQGAGPVGLNVCALASASGAASVCAIDGYANRRTAALTMGATEVFDVDHNTVQNIRSSTGGRGADIVIEASGNPAAVPMGCEIARDGGTYVVVGQYTDAGETLINPHLHINKKHLDIRGCWGSDYSHVYRAMVALNMLQNRFAWERMVTRRYGLEQAEQALLDVEARRVVKAIIEPNGG